MWLRKSQTKSGVKDPGHSFLRPDSQLGLDHNFLWLASPRLDGRREDRLRIPPKAELRTALFEFEDDGAVVGTHDIGEDSGGFHARHEGF